MAKPKTPPNILVESAGIVDIPIKLNAAEITDKAHLAAQLQAERDEVAERFRESKGNYKAQIADLDRRVHTHLGEIKSGMETRPVECDFHFNFEANTKSVVRTDTLEVVEKDVAITDEERQTFIHNPPAETPPAGDPLILTPAGGQQIKLSAMAKASGITKDSEPGFIWVCWASPGPMAFQAESDIIYKSVDDAMFHGLDYVETELSRALEGNKIPKGKRIKIKKTLAAVKDAIDGMRGKM